MSKNPLYQLAAPLLIHGIGPDMAAQVTKLHQAKDHRRSLDEADVDAKQLALLNSFRVGPDMRVSLVDVTPVRVAGRGYPYLVFSLTELGLEVAELLKEVTP